MTPKAPVKTRAEPRHRAAVFWQKALRFAHAALVNGSGGDWDPAVANAVNAAINVADALVVHSMGVRGASDSHFDVLNLLATADVAADVRHSMARHLEALLNVKTIAQYEGRLLGKSDWDKASRHLQRILDATKSVAVANGWPRVGET